MSFKCRLIVKASYLVILLSVPVPCRDNEMLKKGQRDNMAEIQVTKDLEEELKQFRQDSSTIKSLQEQLSVLTQERDSALSMWASSEKQLQRAKRDLVSPSMNKQVQAILKEMQIMQRDYSDAIRLLEGKTYRNQDEIGSLVVANEKLKKDLELAQKQNTILESELAKLEETVNKTSKDREELRGALEKCLVRVDEAVKLEQQARTKVSDAVDLAQQALKQQDVTSKEKEQLMRKVEEFTEVTNERYKEETGKLSKKLEEMKEMLEKTKKEKQELTDEFENVKLECYNKLQELIEKNKALSAQCKELHQKNYTEKLQWTDERKMLRSQIMSLQNCIEQVNANIRDQQFHIPCRTCADMKRRATSYKKIARRWRKVCHEFQERLERKEKTTKMKQ